jgi:hypothetical protein
MQISGVSLALIWPLRICLLRVLLDVMPLLQAFPFPSTLQEVTLHLLSQAGMFIYSSRGEWAFSPLLWSFLPTANLQAFLLLMLGVYCHSCLLWPACLFTAHVGSGSSLLSSGVFLPLPFLQAFLLLVAGCVLLLLPSPAWLIYLQFREGFPSLPVWRSGCPTLFVMCLLCCYCLLFSFSFFPGWGSVCPGGYADLAEDCLWEYCILCSSPRGPRLPMPSGCWCLAAAWEPSGLSV